MSDEAPQAGWSGSSATPAPAAPTPPSARISPRERARRRARIVLTSLAAFLALAVVVAVLFVERVVGTGQPVQPPVPVCTPQPPPPSQVTVRVYNGTDKDRLAAAVSKKLAAQGFRIAGVGNDPKGVPVAGVAEVRHGAAGVLQARTAAARFPGAKLLRDARPDTIVDIVIGAGYRRLATPPPRPTTPGC